MKRSRKDMIRNIQQRTPGTMIKRLVEVALENNPSMIRDFDKLIRTHSCKQEKEDELTERFVALVASELPGADRRYLREVAFRATPIDAGLEKKYFEEVALRDVEREKTGWLVRWGDCNMTLLPFAADGYEPRKSDRFWFSAIRCTLHLGRVVNGHVFAYSTVFQENMGRCKC